MTSVKAFYKNHAIRKAAKPQVLHVCIKSADSYLHSQQAYTNGSEENKNISIKQKLLKKDIQSTKSDDVNISTKAESVSGLD